MRREVRTVAEPVNAEPSDGGGVVLRGYAAVFNSPSELLGGRNGGFIETIAPGAFRDSLQSDDVRLLVNHDPSLILGRNRSGTLKLTENDHGLWFECEIDPEQSYARDAMIAVRRGDMSQCSFAFEVVEDNWDYSDTGTRRTLRVVKIDDVSIVTYPAYTDTVVSAEARSRAVRPETVPVARARLTMRLLEELSR